MKVAVREKITRLLWLTTSDNDHEAIAAMRTANRLLKASGVTWENIMQVNVQHGDDDEEHPEAHHRTPGGSVSEMFEVVRQGKHNDFIESLWAQWCTKNHLSAKQLQALRKFYNNIVERQRQ